MTEKRKILRLGCMAVLALVFLELFLLSPGPRPRAIEIDGAAVARIRPGMTEGDVVRILGVPPGDYTTRKVIHHIDEGAMVSILGFVPAPEPRGTRKTWLLNSKHVAIWFEDGRVEQIETSPAEPAPPKPLSAALRDGFSEFCSKLGW